MLTSCCLQSSTHTDEVDEWTFNYCKWTKYFFRLSSNLHLLIQKINRYVRINYLKSFAHSDIVEHNLLFSHIFLNLLLFCSVGEMLTQQQLSYVGYFDVLLLFSSK